MLSLIGSALGLFSSAIPKAMEMWQDKNDKAHELKLLTLQSQITLDQTAQIVVNGKELSPTNKFQFINLGQSIHKQSIGSCNFSPRPK